jgi:broad specificity phosphatase PhoE
LNPPGMTKFYLVRHAVHSLVNCVLVGRTPGVLLAPEGCEQAKLLARRLGPEQITAVQSSPRERAMETAKFIAAPGKLPVEVVPELDETDFGEWAGCSFEQLKSDARWTAWNTARGTARPPGGESMLELQRRILGHLDRLRVNCPHERIVLVSHAEVIRAALLHYLGCGLDAFSSIEIGPASVSILLAEAAGVRVLAANEHWADEGHAHAFGR